MGGGVQHEDGRNWVGVASPEEILSPKENCHCSPQQYMLAMGRNEAGWSARRRELPTQSQTDQHCSRQGQLQGPSSVQLRRAPHVEGSKLVLMLCFCHWKFLIIFQQGALQFYYASVSHKLCHWSSLRFYAPLSKSTVSLSKKELRIHLYDFESKIQKYIFLSTSFMQDA